MKLLMAAAEFSPLARTGGMGEAVAGLAQALDAHGIEVTVALPRYQHLRDIGTAAADLPVPAYRYQLDEIEVLLVEDAAAFDRPGIYGPKPGEAYDDEWFRWARFSSAVARLAAGFDLIHLHDGHVGPVALLTAVPTVQTIHNASYPILGPLAEAAHELGVSWQDRMLGGPLEWYGQANYLKAGIVGADRVTTVSPTFAAQITTDASVTGGLNEVINWLRRAGGRHRERHRHRIVGPPTRSWPARTVLGQRSQTPGLVPGRFARRSRPRRWVRGGQCGENDRAEGPAPDRGRTRSTRCRWAAPGARRKRQPGSAR